MSIEVDCYHCGKRHRYVIETVGTCPLCQKKVCPFCLGLGVPCPKWINEH